MQLKTLIKEMVRREFRRVLREEAAMGFDLEHLKTLTNEDLDNTEEITAYLRRTLGNPLGNGEFRTTYALGADKVLKLARTDRTQNSNEVKNSKCLPRPYVVQVLDYDPNYWWIIEERLKPLSGEEFVAAIEARIPGMEFDHDMDITSAIEVGAAENPYDYDLHYQELNREMLKSPWYAKLIKVLKKCKVSSEDFHNENWGIRPSTGELVLLDLGF